MNEVVRSRLPFIFSACRHKEFNRDTGCPDGEIATRTREPIARRKLLFDGA